MARDGSGNYTNPYPSFTSGTVISSTQVNANNSDIAAALTASLAKDGQTVPTANLPMGTYRHTGVGNAAARTDYSAAGQVQDSSLLWAGTAGGTADALTLTLTPAITAYAVGQTFRFISSSNANTGAATVAVSGLAAKAIQSGGAALTAGQIEASKLYQIIYDGTAFQVQSVKLGGTGDFLADGSIPMTGSLTLGGAGTGIIFEGATADVHETTLVAGEPTADRTVTLPNATCTLLATDGDGSSLTGVAKLTANSFTEAQRCTEYALSDGATITPDASSQNEGFVVLGGNRTLGIPSNLTAGARQRFNYDFYQDSTGSRTLATAWCYRPAGGTAITLSTTALTRDKAFFDVVYYGTSTVTVTIATPGVVTWTSHGRKTGDQLQLTTTGALPTGLTASTTYYVIYNDANSFWLATSLANAAAGTKIATSGSQSGTHTAVACAIDLTLSKAY